MIFREWLAVVVAVPISMFLWICWLRFVFGIGLEENVNIIIVDEKGIEWRIEQLDRKD